MEKAEPEISNNIDVTLISIKTPIAIPTNVPLKPYNPLRISSLSYPDNEAVKVLTTVPSTDKTASCHELKAIPKIKGKIVNLKQNSVAFYWFIKDNSVTNSSLNYQ